MIERTAPNVLLFDLETSPNLAYCWGFWQQNINKAMVLDRTEILSWSAKWLDSDTVMYLDRRGGMSEKNLLSQLNNQIEEADWVIAHNGDKFDIKKLRGRMAVNGLLPFSPVRSIDTLKTARQEFSLGDNSLETLAKTFDLPSRKGGHKKFPGFELWKECLADNVEAWDEMEEYNRMDVIVLEELYYYLRPWMRNHPNFGMFQPGDVPHCVACGSEDIVKRGYYYTNLSKFQRYRCSACGKWSRGRTNLLTAEERKGILTNAL